MCRSCLTVCLFVLAGFAHAQKWDFTLHKHTSGVPGPTLLVIGGIQGDEPGGFNAAALLTTDYQVDKGEIWVVPNLNFESIIKRSRGVHGDMNRKFKDITPADPEYQLVKKIKEIITDERIDMILNLHDGSGFYRPQYIDKFRNPNRWGQSLIIDQQTVDGIDYGQLATIGNSVVNHTNKRILQPGHYYHVKNTRTRFGNRDMEKTLTYYAIQNGKAAFGVEASKSFNTQYRAFYHLLVIEGFLDYLGIQYRRNFDLSVENVEKRINENIKLALYGDRMLFDMNNVRKRLNYIPIKLNEPINYIASNPLIAVLDKKQAFHVRYGNRSVTKLIPEYFQFDDSINELDMLIDGKHKTVQLGEIINVQSEFMVMPLEKYRVNVIGFTRGGLLSEVGVNIQKEHIRDRYSVDQKGRLYRVEVYREKKFCGMVLVNFTDNPVATISPYSSEVISSPHASTDG